MLLEFREAGLSMAGRDHRESMGMHGRMDTWDEKHGHDFDEFYDLTLVNCLACLALFLPLYSEDRYPLLFELML